MILRLLAFLLASYGMFTRDAVAQQKKDTSACRIQIAFVFDASGSMQGLLDQAKGQLWEVIHFISKGEKQGRKPQVEIAIITAGNAESQENGFCQIITPLTSDIDLIADELNELYTSGGWEFFPYAFKLAIDSLAWSERKKDLKIIFIAGNEHFDQGGVKFKDVYKLALKKNIILNTIYCGNEKDSISEGWKAVAEKMNGEFMSIEKDSAIKKLETIWDKKIIDFNDKLNTTYLPYGKNGTLLQKRQIRQDQQAPMIGTAYMRERALFKVDANYKNPHWDLVDAFCSDSTILDSLLKNDLPEQLKQMSKSEKVRVLKDASKKREVFAEGIRMYCEKADFLLVDQNIDVEKLRSLGSAVISIIRKEAEKNGFSFR